MKLSKVSVFLLIFVLALGACRKKTDQLSPVAKEKPRNTVHTYLVKVSADDAGTAKVWSESFNVEPDPDKTIEEQIRPYVSAYNYNTNDAKITSLIAYYITDNGQEDTPLRIDKDFSNYDLDLYQAVFQVPAGKSVFIEAKAKQTGDVGYSIHSPPSYSLYYSPSSFYYYGSKGNKVHDATVTLKVSILKDGKVVAQEEDKKVDEASLILTVVGK